jgi:hypothetical protein
MAKTMAETASNEISASPTRRASRRKMNGFTLSPFLVGKSGRESQVID